jgi:hypothetical protein
LVLAAVVADVLFTPAGASWTNVIVAICGVFAAGVLLVGDVGDDLWSPTREALRELRKAAR